MTSNLENVKPGDTLLVKARFTEYLVRVDRVTKTHIVCGDKRFSKLYGHKVGDDRWFTSTAYSVTEEEIAEFNRRELELKERRKLINEFHDILARSLSTDQLRRIIEIVKENTQ